MRQVKELTIDELTTITDTGELVFTETEAEFLSEYAPLFYFGNEGAALGITGQREACMRLYDTIVTIDSTLRRSFREKLLDYAKHKQVSVNSVLKFFGECCEANEDDAVKRLFHIKAMVLDFIDRMPRKKNNRIKRKTSDDEFPYVREILTKTFGDVPILLYGEILRRVPNKYNTLVFVPNFTPIEYEKILSIPGPRINVALYPEEMANIVAYYDDASHVHPKSSKIINGIIHYELPDEQHYSRSTLITTAIDIIKLRKALTANSLEHAKTKPHIRSSKLRLRRDIKHNLERNLASSLPTAPPCNHDYVQNLIAANLYVSDLLRDAIAQSF